MKDKKPVENNEPTLATSKDVIKHLSSTGWKIKQSTFYNHKEKGFIRPEKDGKYSIAAVDKYAAARLKRLDGTKKDSIEKNNEVRQNAETRKLIAQAEHWELKSKIARGHYVPKDTFERELAHRAMVFKSDGEAFFRAGAVARIKLVGGDPEKAPDMIEHDLNAFYLWLNRYAADREFVVPAAAPEEAEHEDKDEIGGE